MLITVIVLLLVLALLDLSRWTAARRSESRPRTIKYEEKATGQRGSLRY